MKRAIIFAGLCTGLIGCGSSPNPNPPRVRVAGIILLDNQPAPAGMITFIPAVVGQLQAQGLVQDDGTFVIEEENGPSPGEYKVEIQCAKKTGRRVPSLSNPDGSGMSDERVSVIPARYNTATTLKQTITSGENHLTFRLQSGR